MFYQDDISSKAGLSESQQEQRKTQVRKVYEICQVLQLRKEKLALTQALEQLQRIEAALQSCSQRSAQPIAPLQELELEMSSASDSLLSERESLLSQLVSDTVQSENTYRLTLQSLQQQSESCSSQISQLKSLLATRKSQLQTESEKQIQLRTALKSSETQGSAELSLIRDMEASMRDQVSFARKTCEGLRGQLGAS